MNNLFVAGISYQATEDNLFKHFEDLGFKVISARIIRDKVTGKSRGFGFVQLDSEAEITKAVESGQGSLLLGRRITVKKAIDKRGGEQVAREF